MDPTKLVGRVKELVRIEHKSRRNYPHIWNGIAASETNKFYHPDELEKQLEEKLKILEESESQCKSRFISPEMQKNLLEKCRCGRPRRGMHMGKCLQRALNTTSSDQNMQAEEAESKHPTNMPQTSNSLIGFKTAPYQKLEQSMRYLSPTSSMPGPRITSAPYNVIFIG
ncbi:uncharacterized protein [Drosophila virilis]|uniref:Uncharacterized protein n=1 Tax=Drosophila virilis TaxID=7244 RepID=B4LVJ6_DROVI|nr:uncharacterized protein LOC6627338 [Drosophila virilis]EDW64390.1 uncharacterized protein Dvir_GJ22801 [Drosophila virilis]